MHVKKRYFIYIILLLVLPTTYGAFHFLTQYFGRKTGYFAGFVFYWLFWCLAIPLLFIGKESIAGLFKLRQPVLGNKKLLNMLFLTLPLVLVYSFEFPKVLKQSDAIIIFASVGLSIINATAEEILWRGTLLKLMGTNLKWYLFLSSLGFAIWHFAPLSIFSNNNPGGSLSFIAVSFVLGILYSSVARNTKSILLTTVSHILFDFAGLGARIYF